MKETYYFDLGFSTDRLKYLIV